MFMRYYKAWCTRSSFSLIRDTPSFHTKKNPKTEKQNNSNLKGNFCALQALSTFQSISIFLIPQRFGVDLLRYSAPHLTEKGRGFVEMIDPVLSIWVDHDKKNWLKNHSNKKLADV